jgi:transcriptional regulator with XRE-family HTH domain
MNLLLGRKIRELRKAKGLNQTQMAEMLGVHLQTISRYERGELVPGPDILSVLAEKFHLDANELLGITVDGEAPAYVPKGIDPTSEMILELLKDMDETTRQDVLKYAAEKKLLADLLAGKK